jgi:hypothetical protein
VPVFEFLAAASRAALRPNRPWGCLYPGNDDSATLLDFDLEQLGPQLAGDEEAVTVGVVGDAVQDGALAMEFALVNDALQIDSSQDLPGVRGNAHNVVRLPDVGVDFTLYPFELIEIFDWPPGLIRHSQAANGMERLGIEEAQVEVPSLMIS